MWDLAHVASMTFPLVSINSTAVGRFQHKLRKLSPLLTLPNLEVFFCMDALFSASASFSASYLQYSHNMAPTTGLNDCCKSGVIHEGESKGTFQEIAGVRTYVALPAGDYDKTVAHVFCPDVFGFELINNRLLADSFALNGIPTYIPDFFNGDALNEKMMNNPDFNLRRDWKPKHGPETVRPSLDAVISQLRKNGVTRLAGNSHCFGARYAVDLVLEGTFTLGVFSHPSNLQIPEDLEALKAKVAPVLFNTCETDQAFPIESQKLADEIFKDDVNYKRTYWPGCKHGFAVRGDLSIPEVKRGKEGAFAATVEWIKGHV